MYSCFEISTDIKRAQEIQYDADAKKIMHYRLSLAFALKASIPEFFHYSIGKIIPLIEPHKKESKGKKRILGEPTELKPRGGPLYLDILFKIKLPSSSELTDVIVNLEIQRKGSNLLHKRATEYIAQIKEEQRYREGLKTDYNRLKKVLSIWLIFNPNKKDRNTVKMEQIGVRDATTIPIADVEKWYDDETIVFINIDENEKCYNNKSIRFFQVLFSSKLQFAEKSRLLKEEFDISIKREELEDVINSMCNLSLGIRENTLSEGLKMGLKKGRLDEKREIAIAFYKDGTPTSTIIKNTGCSYDDLKLWAKEAGLPFKN